jgi:hypothetical protein
MFIYGLSGDVRATIRSGRVDRAELGVHLMDPLSLRSNNPFLASLAAVAPEFQEYAIGAVELLPHLSVSLMDFARYYGAKMVASYNKRTSELNAQYLVLSIHDVQLNHVFAHILGATHVQAIAENFVGALLFQAIGKSPRCDDQSIFLGLSYKLRGLEKYAAAARMFPGVKDPVGETFGKEFGQLIFGRISEDVIRLGSSKLLEIGSYTDANIRGIMLGEIFSDEERARVEATCAEHDKKISREIQELRKKSPSTGI